MIEPFSAWTDFQQDLLALQKAQLDAARKAIEAAGDVNAAREAMLEAGKAQAQAWAGWLKLWGVGK